jgi:hypothetical protein
MVTTSKIASLPIEKNNDQTSLSDIYTDFECISLETNEKSIFGAVSKLMVYDHQFFILDNSKMKKIYVFREDGSFSHTIGQKGNGPGEYTNVEDFTIDKEKNQLVALTYPSTVFVYKLNGDFVRKQRLTSKSMLWNIVSFKDGYVCSTNQQSALGDSLLDNYNKDFVLTSTSIEPLPFQVSLPPFITNPILTDNNQQFYFDNFTSTFYTNITSKTESDAIHFNIDELMKPEAFQDAQQLLAKQHEYSFFFDAIVAGNFLYATYYKKGEVLDMIYDIKTRKYTVSKAMGWRPRPLLYQDAYFYTSVNAPFILGDEKYLNAKLKTKFPITTDSNPLIIRYQAIKRK